MRKLQCACVNLVKGRRDFLFGSNAAAVMRIAIGRDEIAGVIGNKKEHSGVKPT